MDPEKSTFLCLPPEIRDNIYGQLLRTETIDYRPSHNRKQPYLFGLAFVSRAISVEFTDHVYRCGLFVFRLKRQYTRGYHDWKVSDNVLRRVRRCRFQRDIRDSLRLAWEDWQLWLPGLLRPLQSLVFLQVEVVYPKNWAGDENVEAKPFKGSSEDNEPEHVRWEVPKDVWDSDDHTTWLL